MSCSCAQSKSTFLMGDVAHTGAATLPALIQLFQSLLTLGMDQAD